MFYAASTEEIVLIFPILAEQCENRVLLSNAKDADMRTRINSTRLKLSLVGLSTSGLLLATTCTANDLRAVVIGIEAAAAALSPGGTQIVISEPNNDLNFG